MDCSPPGSSAHGIFQARTLEWVAISFSNVWKWKVKAKSLSRVRLFATPWTAAHQIPLSITSSQSLLKLMSMESVMPSNHLMLCRPLLLPPSNFPSIRVFSNESLLPIRWPKYWSYSFSISSFNKYSGLISFRMDWLDLLAVQGTHRSLLKHHSSKASILQLSAFFIFQLSHSYVTTGNMIALTLVQFSRSVVSDICNPKDFSTLGLPVLHQLPEVTQTHVHWVGNATQPSHSLSSLSPPAFNLSQHQGLFKWVSFSHQVAIVLVFQLQHKSFQ